MVRTLKEELGLSVDKNDLRFIDIWTWYFPEVTVAFPTFVLSLQSKPALVLDPSKHTAYKWLTAKDYYAMDEKDVVHGIHDLLRYTNYVKD